MNDSTIDPREVSYYERQSDFWWDAKGPFWPLHGLNELRVQWIREQLCRHFERDISLDEPLTGLRVLDIGCGGGILAETMTAMGARVTAIDMAEAPLAVARLHLKKSGMEIDYLRVSSVSPVPLPPAVLLFSSALALLGWVGTRRDKGA